MRARVAMLIAWTVLLGGCSSGIEGSPVAAERWDPCSIPDEAIQATGLDPATKDEGWGEGIVVDDWAICEYLLPGARAAYALAVLSSVDHTIVEARAKSANRDGRDLVVGGRDAYMYKTEFGAAIRDCNIALEVPPGVVVFTVLYQRDDGADACEVGLEHVHDLESAVPAAPK
ncbi:DUF3558 family protein [Rhodococcus sp. I2R]|jgi:hypothetical protein|uniref:DUF3558 family protein n=1 Tax=Rhodococcus sp. I2R TaxID=2855445 RepID=UPI001E3E7925|nr:DUF3558 family protein [Rhodococcus sp. I2R]